MKKILLLVSILIPSFAICMNSTCPATVAAPTMVTHNHALIPYPPSAIAPYTQKTYLGYTHHQQKRRTPQTNKKITAHDKARILSDKINRHIFGDKNSNNLANKLSRSIVNNYSDEEFMRKIEKINSYIKTIDDDNVIQFLAKKNTFFNAVVERICKIDDIRPNVILEILFNRDLDKGFDLSPAFNRHIADQIVTNEIRKYKKLDVTLRSITARNEIIQQNDEQPKTNTQQNCEPELKIQAIITQIIATLSACAVAFCIVETIFS